MSEQYVVVATFSLPVEAQVACARLRDEGIPAQLTGDIASSAFAGLAGVGGRIELHVPASHYDQALAILEDVLEEQEARADPNRRRRREYEEDLWVCSLCGEALGMEVTVCPACGTSREAVTPAASDQLARGRAPRRPASEQLKTDAAPAAIPGLTTGIEIPPVQLERGDHLAGRSLKVAFVALLLLPECMYAFGVLAALPLCVLACAPMVPLLLHQGELSRGGMWKMYVALAIDVGLVLLAFWVALGLIGAIRA
jgi:hypothetical protein